MRLPNKTSIGGMTAFHAGNLIKDVSSSLTAGTSVTINYSKVVNINGMVVFMANITLSAAVAQWAVLLTLTGGYYSHDYVIDKTNHILLSQNGAGAIFLKAADAAGLAAGTYDLVFTFVNN